MHFNSAEEVEQFLDETQARFFKVAVVDIDGVLRGKYVSRTKLSSILRKGFGFCDVILGWDSADALYDGGTIAGYHTGYRDAPVAVDGSSLRRLPEEANTVLFLGRFGEPYQGACPRSLLDRVIQLAESHGFFPRGAFEYEFFVFNETPHSVRAKSYNNLVPWTPGMFGYSVLRSSVHADIYRELFDFMSVLDVPIEGLHTETGPGVIEAALEHAPLREAADRAALFKTFTKVFFQRRGQMATFMAKWSPEYPGQSGHFHLSLEDEHGKNLFYDPSTGLSPLFQHFLAGQTLLLPEFLAMSCATVNAYRRLVPGMWAPTQANWGVENRTTAIRAIPAGPDGTRSEYRVGPADGNPYLVASAALASGLYGIMNQLVVPPVEGNAYEQTNSGPSLPENLAQATESLASSKNARDFFGDVFVDHFTATRRWETRASQGRDASWDLERYFEII